MEETKGQIRVLAGETTNTLEKNNVGRAIEFAHDREPRRNAPFQVREIPFPEFGEELTRY